MADGVLVDGGGGFGVLGWRGGEGCSREVQVYVLAAQSFASLRACCQVG